MAIRHFMCYFDKFINAISDSWPAGVIAAGWSLLLPVHTLIYTTSIFIGIDFITGCLASYKRAKRKGEKWSFESSRAWDTILKLAFSLTAIVMAWLIEDNVLNYFTYMHLANIVCGFICGVEFWSYLENISYISNHPAFLWIKKIVGKKLGDAGIDLDQPTQK